MCVFLMQDVVVMSSEDVLESEKDVSQGVMRLNAYIREFCISV